MPRQRLSDEERRARRAESKRRSAERRKAGLPPLRGPVQCGTPPGYVTHLRAGEDACDECKAAWAADAKRRRTATDTDS